jgi:hypothetical protein
MMVPCWHASSAAASHSVTAFFDVKDIEAEFLTELIDQEISNARW